MSRYLNRPAGRDANEPEIVKALEAVGATVTLISQDGVPDLLVGYQGRSYQLEVKHLTVTGKTARPTSGGKRPDARGLTEAQQKWWAAWLGAPPVIVRTPAEALAAIGVDRPIAIGAPQVAARTGFDARAAAGSPIYQCSFCGRDSRDAKAMVSGPRVFICDDCIDLCTEIVVERRAAAEDRTRKCAELACIKHLNHSGSCSALQPGEPDPWADRDLKPENITPAEPGRST